VVNEQDSIVALYANPDKFNNITPLLVRGAVFIETSRHHFDAKAVEGTSTQGDRVNSDSSSKQTPHFT
jgi:hypothetical protein